MTHAHGLGLWTLALAAALFGLGCRSISPPEAVARQGTAGELPDEVPTLLAVAAEAYDPEGPISDVRRSLAAAEEVLVHEPGQEAAAFLAARATLWLLELGGVPDGDEAHALATRGLERAEVALAAAPDRVDRVFVAGALLGRQLEQSRAPGLARLRRVHEAFERAVALDPGYDDGAPLRALGMLLVRAPQWPSGIGDAETGLDLLREAAQRVPTHPANHFYLAEGLDHEGYAEEAAVEYQRVLELCVGTQGAVCATYARRTDERLHPGP